jgi:hypothetical protein
MTTWTLALTDCIVANDQVVTKAWIDALVNKKADQIPRLYAENAVVEHRSRGTVGG